MNLSDAVAAAVRTEVARRGVSQADLALVLGLSQPAVSDRMRGRTPFTLRDLERLAQLLGVDVRELVQPVAVPA